MECVVIGVDLAAGSGVTAMATLRVVQGAPQSLATISLLNQSFPSDDNAILAEIARSGPRFVGIDAPLTLPAPVAAALTGASLPVGISPYTRAAERDPIWSRLGVRPFPVSFLGGLTFRAIPLAARIRAQSQACQVIEVFPSAALVALGLHPLTPPRGARQQKTTPEARRQTQSQLAQFISGIAQTDDDTQPFDADSLDALAAALTAAAAALGGALVIGDQAEGAIVLPAHAAQSVFARVDMPN